MTLEEKRLKNIYTIPTEQSDGDNPTKSQHMISNQQMSLLPSVEKLTMHDTIGLSST